MSDQGNQVPLVEQLEAIAEDTRLIVQHGPFSSSYYAMGRMSHKAAAELRRQHSEIEALKAERDALRDALEVVLDDLMYKDHARVIDVARAALKAREEKP